MYQFDFGRYPPNGHACYERYAYFMEHTGLFDLLQNHIINISLTMRQALKPGLIQMAGESWRSFDGEFS